MRFRDGCCHVRERRGARLVPAQQPERDQREDEHRQQAAQTSAAAVTELSLPSATPICVAVTMNGSEVACSSPRAVGCVRSAMSVVSRHLAERFTGCHSGVVAGFGLVRRSPGLAGLLAAQTISPLGDAMATTALILHVQRTTGSATAVGLLLFAQAIPPLAAPLAGVIADRFNPGRLLAVGWLTQAVLAGLVALLLPPLGALLVVVFLLALVDTPLSAAVGRCIPAVVADDDLVAANAMRSAVAELGTVLGPPLAGLLFAVSGTRLVLGLDALTFLAVIPLALRLPSWRGTPTAGLGPRSSAMPATGSRLSGTRHTSWPLPSASGSWCSSPRPMTSSSPSWPR